ncbi:hypothetical protein LAZ67_20001410 [Cordylochernes scorpioides]|uniref:Integrase catalytic domain-containing protein n=1 Tax=Cordylochernes scorpioides TaxID=51811 RepID=A0ABY6LK43_9ARAC|nr:hypothetical protein LAZ67_20001410 [Cordylochernes scorpioides]
MADQPVSSAELKKLRTPVRARFTKAFNELETEIKKKEVKKADVEKILRRLQTHHEKLSILNMRMEEALLRESVSEDIFIAEYESVCEYEDNFSNIMTDYEALADAEKDDVSTISGTAAMNYRLPKLEFKKFGGEPREWITFWSQFSTIDRDPQMPPETKFQYLFQATAENSEAREAVESFPPSADNYPKVIEYIKSRFGEDEMLVEIYVRDLLQNVLQNVRAEGKMSVVKLYDRLETQLRALETLGVARDKFAAMLYPLVESALPEDTLRVWERNRSEGREIANTTQMRNNCIFCGNGHPSQECYSGQRMHLPEKKDKAKGKNVCFWCLLPGHGFKKCRIKPRCPVCGGKHYPIMCPTLEAQKTSHLQKAELKVSGESPATKQETANQFTSTTLNNATVGGVYLQTLIVKISGPKGKHNVRVLLDCGSQRSNISKRMVDALGLKRVQQVTLTHNLFGGGEIRQKKHNVYKVNVSSLNNEYMDDLKLLDQEVICGHISQVQDHTILNELKARGINLTDICQGEVITIHMLIGSDLLSSILTGRMQILQSGVVATETKLGWTVMGPAIGNDMEDSCLIVTSLHVNSFDVQDLWKLDVLGIMDAAETKSWKDLIEASNTHFKETVKREESGRYIVSLPWIAGHPPVPGKMLYEKYDTIFEEWEKEKFIEEVEDKWEECSYFPHRPVLKDSRTTPIRPVFDASCKKKGLPSLNQCLEKGDNLIELIPDLLLRFRLGKYGIIADIRKAFLQIQVREEYREFLRFLWWKKDQKTLKFYRHCRLVFGLTSSPFLLAATIKYHLSLPQFQDNRCAELLARSFYVDNCILSLSPTHDVKKFTKESSDIMMQAKFELRDWMWNEPGITEQDPASILGMKWHLQTDTIAINVQSLKNIDEEKSITKGSILSACHRIFDPIQFTCPATIKIKKMVQDAWKENKSWDEPLNEDRRVEFIKWRKQALELDLIKIPRWILPIKGRTTLHVFCDASAIAYATVIFMRIENASVIVVRFFETRNRLATIKRITIPRLELLACLIGARLLVHVLENLEESPEKIQCWTDSSLAIYWIQQQENWAQFVSNRVKEITTLTKSEDWNHVAGEHNPADLPFRGESPSKFIKSGWWEGPKWLQEKKEDWPVSKVQYDLEAIEEERRKTVVAGFVAKKPEENPWYPNLYEGQREVTLTQILRVIAWMLRFKPSEYKGDIISQEELDSAEKSLVKIIQSESIGEEDPKMKQLHAFQDKEGLWRVKTRITLRSVLREKFWIPKARQLVRLVIHKCPRCRRFEAKRVDVPEASLPQHRVRDVVVFEVTGIDLGGPLYLEDGQKNPDLTLSLAINQGQAAEASQKQLRNIEKYSIDAIRKNFNEKYKPTTSLKNSYTSNPVRANFNKSIRCSKCNMAHDFGKCPAYGKECYKCRQPNHFSNCCKNRAVRCIQEIEEEKDNLLIIDSIMVGQVLRKPWKELIYIQGHPVDIKLDTGADVNILPERLIKEWPNMPLLETADCKIYTYTRQQIPVVGKCQLDCKTKYACRKVTFLIVNNSAVPLLGLDECEKLNLVKRVETISDISVTLTGLLDKYKDVFKGNGHLSYMYDIKLSDKAGPKISPARRLPSLPVKEELFKMEEDGIIEKIEEPTVWAHPMVVVKKPSGKYRICIDPRELNEWVLREHYTLPAPENILAEIPKAKSAFWQVPLSWPLYKKNLPSNLKLYWEFKEELHEWQNLICRGNKLLIPKTQRNDMLKILHASHQGINNTIALAKGSIYWPGMNKEIEELINNCSICQQTSRANFKEPMLPHQAPEYPWQKVGIDIFQIESSKYLLIVDYFSKYPEIYQHQDMTTDTIIRRLKRTFSNFGIPENLTSQFVPSMINNEAIQKQLVDNQVKMKNYYDRHTRPADPLSIKDRVWFRKDKRWIPGQLKNQANEPRSFYVKDQEGNEYRRNSIHIREDKRSDITHTDWEKPLELNQEQTDLQDLEESPSRPTSSGQLSSPGSPENVTTTGPPGSCTNGSPGNLITTRSVIYSDNGTNLVGLRNELYRVNFGVKWKLNPPAAPGWGGWIERIVGLTKKLLRRLLGKRVVNYEEMVTLLENCERVINARPLTYIAEDNDDLVPLTPEMFLREPRAEGEIDLTEFRCNFGKSYEKRKRLLKEFRKRFRSEYLGLLVHHDNRKKQRQLKVGDIVLVEVENRKQINWPMGKITKVFPGTDNVRRLVEVKTKSGFMKRAVQRLFPLEVPTEDIEQGDGELKPAEDEIVRKKTSGVESALVQEKTTPVKNMPRHSRRLLGGNTAASRRYRNARAIETPLQSETRRALRRLRYSEARVAATQTMQVPVQRIQLWTHKPISGLQYNAHIDYKADSSVDIDQMSRVCQFCSALRFKDEPFGLCCKQGRVSLPAIESPPEPIFSLLSGQHPLCF